MPRRPCFRPCFRTCRRRFVVCLNVYNRRLLILQRATEQASFQPRVMSLSLHGVTRNGALPAPAAAAPPCDPYCICRLVSADGVAYPTWGVRSSVCFQASRAHVEHARRTPVHLLHLTPPPHTRHVATHPPFDHSAPPTVLHHHAIRLLPLPALPPLSAHTQTTRPNWKGETVEIELRGGKTGSDGVYYSSLEACSLTPRPPPFPPSHTRNCSPISHRLILDSSSLQATGTALSVEVFDANEGVWGWALSASELTAAALALLVMPAYAGGFFDAWSSGMLRLLVSLGAAIAALLGGWRYMHALYRRDDKLIGTTAELSLAHLMDQRLHRFELPLLPPRSVLLVSPRGPAPAHSCVRPRVARASFVHMLSPGSSSQNSTGARGLGHAHHTFRASYVSRIMRFAHHTCLSMFS